MITLIPYYLYKHPLLFLKANCYLFKRVTEEVKEMSGKEGEDWTFLQRPCPLHTLADSVILQVLH